MFKKILEKTLDKLLYFQSFRDYINCRTSFQSGLYFTQDKNNFSISQVFADYRFVDIQSEDIVLDIGANIGAFGMFVSKDVKHVYAIEPITKDVLAKNILLNNIKNITVFEMALGNGDITINWEGYIRKIKGTSLSEFIKMCGGKVDFLKCDCEGGEWSIKSGELKGIRRIEMEVHNLDGNRNCLDYLKILSDAGFVYEIVSNNDESMIVHARNKLLWVRRNID